MGKGKTKGGIEEQFVCPSCAKAIDYKDIHEYKRGSPERLMKMGFYDFLKQKTGVYEDGKKGRDLRLQHLCNILRDGRLFEEYVSLPDDKYKTQWHVKKIEQVKDLYSLTKREIFAIQNQGRITWGKLNKVLRKNNLSKIELPYEYAVTYPLKKAKK